MENLNPEIYLKIEPKHAQQNDETQLCMSIVKYLTDLSY